MDRDPVNKSGRRLTVLQTLQVVDIELQTLQVVDASGACIMEADNRQVTIVFTVQPSFHHLHSTHRVSWSVAIVGERAVTPHLVVRRRW